MAVQYVNKGAFASGTGALTVGVPSGYTAGNLFLLMANSANQAITTPSGWTEVSNSPQYTGMATWAGGVRLAVFYKWVTGSESSVSVVDSGNYTTAIISEWSGVHSTTPIHLTAGRVDSTATASLSCAGLTTTVNGCMIVNAIGLDTDAASTAILSSWSNGSLVSITEGHDQTVSSGVGGGIGFGYGIKTTAGTVSATTVTGSTSTTHAYVTVALTPAPEIITGSTTLTGTGAVVAAGTAAPPTQTVVATMDASKVFRVLDEVIENTSFIIGSTGTVEVGELIEGSVFELGPTGTLTVVELIEGNV